MALNLTPYTLGLVVVGADDHLGISTVGVARRGSGGSGVDIMAATASTDIRAVGGSDVAIKYRWGAAGATLRQWIFLCIN